MIAVIGAGFNGIYAAWRLAQAGKSVVLFAGSQKLGGTMQSRQWRNFSIDIGAQVLDLRTAESEGFYADILGNRLCVLDAFSAGSITTTAVTCGIEFPDFSLEKEFCTAALEQLRQKHCENEMQLQNQSDNYVSHVIERFGDRLGTRMIGLASKLSGGSVEQFGSGATLNLSALNRAKLGSDAEMVDLKRFSAHLNERLAVTTECGFEPFLGKNSNPRFGYVLGGGLEVLWRRAERRLRDLGVQIEFGTTVVALRSSDKAVTLVLSDQRSLEVDAVAWTLSDRLLASTAGVQAPTSESSTVVGLDLHVFEVKSEAITGPEYLNNFIESHLSSRFACGGVVSGQVRRDGTTFITAEVPIRRELNESPNVADSEHVWSECKEVGYVHSGANLYATVAYQYPNAFHFDHTGGVGISIAGVVDAACGVRVQSCRSAHRGRQAFIEAFNTRYFPRLVDA